MYYLYGYPWRDVYAWTDILRLDIYTPKQTYAKPIYAWYFFRGVKFAYYAYSYAWCTFHLTPGLYIWNWKWFHLDRAGLRVIARRTISYRLFIKPQQKWVCHNDVPLINIKVNWIGEIPHNFLFALIPFSQTLSLFKEYVSC